MGNFKKEILRLEKENRNINELLKILDNKSIRKKITLNSYLKSKGFKNYELAVSTLKFIKYDIQRFTEVDVDMLTFLIYFTFHPKEIEFDDNNFTSKQLREINKIKSSKLRNNIKSSNNWKEIKIRADNDNLSPSELYIKIRESILLDYIRYFSRN